MPRPVHFEIHADQPGRAIKFYQAMFGWEIKKWDGSGEMKYWLITTGKEGEPGIDGGLLKRRSPPPTDGQAVNAYVCTMGVDNLDDMLVQLKKNGGNETVPKMPIPGMGWLAYGKDTEGNIFGMMQMDTSAK